MLDMSAAKDARTAGEAITAIYKAIGGKSDALLLRSTGKAVDYCFENYPFGNGYLTIESRCTFIQVVSSRLDLPHVVSDQLPKGRGSFMISLKKDKIERGALVLWSLET